MQEKLVCTFSGRPDFQEENHNISATLVKKIPDFTKIRNTNKFNGVKGSGKLKLKTSIKEGKFHPKGQSEKSINGEPPSQNSSVKLFEIFDTVDNQENKKTEEDS